MTEFLTIFHKCFVPFMIFLILFVVDFVLGFSKGLFYEGVSSSKLRLSIPKFLGYMGAFVAFVCLDVLILTSISDTYKPFIALTVCIAFSLIELKSIVENLKALKIDIPEFVVNIINSLSNKINKPPENDTEQKGALKLMTFWDWRKSVIGKALDVDGVSGVQCVDLIHHYLKNCFGIPVTARGNARDYWNAYTRDKNLQKHFTRIPNTPDLLLKIGDIVIWNYAPYGHIAVCTGEGDLHSFVSIDQNYGQKAGQEVKHSFTNVIGILRPKDYSSLLLHPAFKTGTYTLNENCGVYQLNADGSKKIKNVSQLTADGKKHATQASGKAYLKKGTKVTVNSFTLDPKGSIWANIPSGAIVAWHISKRVKRIK